MPPTSNPTKPKVFISYAHESDEFRNQVKELANWLGQQGCEMLTDHPYLYRPPREGWQAWMLSCIQKANVVLVVCTESFRSGFEKTGPVNSGFGRTYESVILTQDLYDDAMQNDKIYPILPDGGDRKNIPIILRSWENGHCFPSGRQNILRMIQETVSHPSESNDIHKMTENDPAMTPLDSHQLHAIELLGAAESQDFTDRLRREFGSRFGVVTPQNACELVMAFCQVPKEKVNTLFILIRQALKKGLYPGTADQARKTPEQAAIALYCLAARRLVCQEICRLGKPQDRAYDLIFQVPQTETLIVAIIANAVIGGKLRFETSLNAEIPEPSFAYEVDVSGGTELIEADFERALYCAIYENNRRVTLDSLDSGPLSPQQRDDLLARVATIREVDEDTLTLVVRGLTSQDGIEPWVTDNQVPVFLASSELTAAVLNVSPTKLLAGIKEFWRELQIVNQPDHVAKTEREKPSTTRDTPMSSSPTINLNIQGPVTNVTTTTGDHSPATVNQTQGADLSALAREIRAAIDALGASDDRDRLLPHAEKLVAEAGKPGAAESVTVRDTLKAIKNGADYIDAGGTIIDLCNKAYTLLGPVLGLP